MIECDVLVLGAGLSGGLPAATYLQKAGLKVVLIERGIDSGKFYHSYDLLPGLTFDHSPVNFSCMSSAVLDLDLQAEGYEIRLPPILHSVTDSKGNNATFIPISIRPWLSSPNTHRVMPCGSARSCRNSLRNGRRWRS